MAIGSTIEEQSAASGSCDGSALLDLRLCPQPNGQWAVLSGGGREVLGNVIAMRRSHIHGMYDTQEDAAAVLRQITAAGRPPVDPQVRRLYESLVALAKCRNSVVVLTMWDDGSGKLECRPSLTGDCTVYADFDDATRLMDAIMLSGVELPT